jgi:hypothetical protein
MRGLDNWITGHYGADQPSERRDDSIGDEGLLTLDSAMTYLMPRADADEEDQLIGDFEAFCILEIAKEKILREYECGYCGQPIARRKDRFCSKGCHDAARDY